MTGVVFTEAVAPMGGEARRLWMPLVARLERFRLWRDPDRGYVVDVGGQEHELGPTSTMARGAIFQRWSLRRTLQPYVARGSRGYSAETFEAIGSEWTSTARVGAALSITGGAALQRLRRLERRGLIERSQEASRVSDRGRPQYTWRRRSDDSWGGAPVISSCG